MKLLRLLFTMGLCLVAAIVVISETRAADHWGAAIKNDALSDVSILNRIRAEFEGARPSDPPPAQTRDESPADKAKQQFAAMKTHYTAGVQALAAKQYESAVAELSQASVLGPNQPAVWAYLAEAYAGLAGTKPEADRKPLFMKAVLTHTALLSR